MVAPIGSIIAKSAKGFAIVGGLSLIFTVFTIGEKIMDKRDKKRREEYHRNKEQQKKTS